jgi:leucyl-tRNA synthetase
MPEDRKINFAKIESKWQKKWEERKIFGVKENSKKPKFYNIEMFPYPSGSGLHMGHALNFTIGDIYARFKRMQGFNVLYPMGYDSLGLPAENAAIKDKTHPEDYTKKSTAYFMKQQKILGLSYDWSRVVNTSHSDYYKWDQWIFLKMLENGLAYRKNASVNWCPSCRTVLANEQAQGGICERCKTPLEIKHLEQWFLKITNYADELLDKIDSLDWPQRTKAMQKNWIGKSYGTEIDFEINGKKWLIFTTRPDTIYGVTFMVVSSQHIKLMELVTDKQKKEVEKFLKKLKSVSEKEMVDMDKQGVFTGSYAINPITKEKVPVYAGNFVIADYGSGMVMAVPAHDQRDFEFAKKYEIPIKVVIDPIGEEIEKPEKMTHAYTEKGNLINSGEFNGIENEEAKKKITEYLENKKSGRKVVQFKLRDWLISRQRYWGTPIPVVYCDKCGIVPVSEKDLPVKLPREVKFGEGNPLLTNEKWIKTKCPKCKGDARRETDTMDTFVNSSWYFLRYCDSKNFKEIFDRKKVKYWMPIDQYIGGAEHACMHLIYCRFYTKFLRDLGLLDFGEPAKKLFHQGMLHGEDGNKMSKSLGNVIDPIDVIKKYSADSLRLALMSFASPDSDTKWDEKVLVGSYKFLNKVYEFFENVKISKKVDSKIDSKNRKFLQAISSNEKIESKLNKIIGEVSNQIENFKYNLAIIKIRELFNSLPEECPKGVLEKSLKLLHVFCPHITEELWEKIGNKDFISLEKWPEVEEKKIDEKYDKQEEAVDKVVADILNIQKIVESKCEDKKKIYVYVLPNEKEFYKADDISKRVGKEIFIFAVNDAKKYDPKNISKKSKPGKPGIYME